MGTELIDQMVHVDEEQGQVVDFGGSGLRFRVSDDDVHQIEKAGRYRMIQLFELPAVIVVVWIQSSDIL